MVVNINRKWITILHVSCILFLVQHMNLSLVIGFAGSQLDLKSVKQSTSPGSKLSCSVSLDYFGINCKVDFSVPFQAMDFGANATSCSINLHYLKKNY